MDGFNKRGNPAGGRRRQKAAAVRAAGVLRLHLAGRSYAEIGRELGVSRQRVGQIIKAALDDCSRERVELAEFAFDREYLFLNAQLREASAILMRGCDGCNGDDVRRSSCMRCGRTGYFYPVAKRLAAIDRIGRLQDRRIRLLGLDRELPLAHQDEPADPGRFGELDTPLSDLTVEEIDRLFYEDGTWLDIIMSAFGSDATRPWLGVVIERFYEAARRGEAA